MTNASDQKAYKLRESLKGRKPRTTAPITDSEWQRVKALIDNIKSRREKDHD